LTLDVAHLRFFDDDSCSSTENETVFGRTLDTISEEDEDEARERVAATAGVEDEDNECSLHEDLRKSADLSKLAPRLFQFISAFFAGSFYLRSCVILIASAQR